MSGISDRNPYVGPRSIQSGESLYGRDAEVLELFHHLQARRIVVLHSPSGAGKSSLVQAGLIPRLRAAKFDVWKPIRVNLDPAGLDGLAAGCNRFALSVILSLEDELPTERQRSAAELSRLSLARYLETRPRRKNQLGRPLVLLFDQFEEVLTVAPHALAAKRAFFDELGEALAHENYWALFIIREDFLAAFAPYRDRLPTQMVHTFRLDLLERGGAREAALRPALAAGREFPAVDQLIRDLSMVQVQRDDGSFATEQGNYVEPVQLQVVCRRLWAAMPEDRLRIDAEDIEQFASVSESLAGYYAQAVAEVAGDDVIVQRTIREWIGEQLIVGGIRSQVRQGVGSSEGLGNELIAGLQRSYLVRMEQRVGGNWYELSHDRLVEPVLADNQRWAQQHLHPLQVHAKLWEGKRRPRELLLGDEVVDGAVAWARANDPLLTADEREFVEQSLALRTDERRRRRRRRDFLATGMLAMVTVSLVLWRLNGEIEQQNLALEHSQRAIEQQNLALEHKERAQRRALSEQLGSQAQMLIRSDDEAEALVLGIRAVGGYDPTWTEAPPPEALEGLSRVLGEDAILVRPRANLQGHEGPVFRVVFSPDGSRFATASQDRTARLWRASDGELLVTLTGHSDVVADVAWAPDGTQVATASLDGRVKLWTTDGGALATLDGQQGGVRRVSYAPDGSLLASGGDDRSLLWSTANHEPVHALGGHGPRVRGLEWAPDGRYFMTAGHDDAAVIWDPSTGKPRQRLAGHGGVQTGVRLSISPDGAQIVTSVDDRALLWTAASGELLHEFATTAEILASSFSPDGRQLALAGHDGLTTIFDARSHVLVATLTAHDKQVNGLDYSPDGTRIATASNDADVKIWDSATGKHLATLSGHLEGVITVAYAPDGRGLVSGSFDDTVRLWDTAIDERVVADPGHRNNVDFAVFTHGDERVVSSSQDRTVRFWNAATGRRIITLAGHTKHVRLFSSSPDGTRIATASEDGTIKIWDAEDGRELMTLAGHEDAVVGVAYSPDGTRLASASWDMTARIWDAQSGRELVKFAGHDDRLVMLGVSPDGEHVVSASQSGAPRIWTVSTGAELAALEGHKGVVNNVLYGVDGKILASAGEDRTVRLWNSRTGALLQVIEGHTDQVFGVDFSPDGERMVTGSYDGTARIWAVDSGAPLQVLAGHDGRIYSVRYSPDSRLVLTASADQTARIWDAGTGEQVHTLSGHRGEVTSAVFSSDGARIVTSSEDDTARIWDARTGELVVELGDTFSLRRADGELVWPIPAIELARIGCERLRVVEREVARVEAICEPLLADGAR